MTAEVRHHGEVREYRARPLRFVAPTAVAASVATAFVYVAVRNPYENSLTGPCALLHTTGLFCPGCGATRAAYEITQGDVLGALHMNAFFTLLVLPAAIVGLAWWIAALSGMKVPQANFSQRAIWTVVGLMALFWIARNVPWFEPYLSP
jgi:hypothetical protein